MLQISVRKLLGQTKLDVSFVASGRSIALFGPSGSGKTSTLNMIAGLLKPDDGRVVADEVTPFDKTKRVYEAGVPIDYVSHAESEVRRMSDTIVPFADGKVVDVRASHE